MTHRILNRVCQAAINKPNAATAYDFITAASFPPFFTFTSRTIATGDTLGYEAMNESGDYERGLGTWNDTTKTLTRTTIRESTSANAAVDWSGSASAVTVISDGRQEEDSPASHALDSHTGTLAKTYGGWGEDASSIWDGATKTLTARVINSDTSATDLIVATANVTSGLSLPIYVFAGSTSDTSSGGGDFQAFAGNGWYGGSLVFAGGSSDVGTGGNGGNCEFYPGISLTGGANGFTTFYSGLFGGTPVISIYDDTVSSYFSLFSATGITGTDTLTAVTTGNTDGEISGLTISLVYSQAEVQALRNKCEELADDVRAMNTQLTAIITLLKNLGAAV